MNLVVDTSSHWNLLGIEYTSPSPRGERLTTSVLGSRIHLSEGGGTQAFPFLIAHSSVKGTEKVLHVTEPVSASLWLPLL